MGTFTPGGSFTPGGTFTPEDGNNLLILFDFNKKYRVNSIIAFQFQAITV
jgi:hypothetical protein